MMEKILSNTTICVLGQKGTGKTYGAAILANSIQDRKVVMLDTVGTWTRDNLISGATYLRLPASQSPTEMFKLLDKYMKESKRLVIDTSGMLSSELVDFSDIFSTWAMDRGNMSLFVDEIAGYCPQDRRYYSYEMERVVMWGRNYGIRPFCFISQRPQKANKDVLALSDYYIIFRLLHNLDRNKVKDLAGLKPDEWEQVERKIMGLKQRKALTFDTDLNIGEVEFPEIKKGGK